MFSITVIIVFTVSAHVIQPGSYTCSASQSSSSLLYQLM
jgi:hypothetical protein